MDRAVYDELRFKASQALADAFDYRGRLLRRALMLLEDTPHKNGTTWGEIILELQDPDDHDSDHGGTPHDD